MRGLTHYTRDLPAVVNILSNGFAWVPNKRKLMPNLAPIQDFSQREPQEFGMISFTDQESPAPEHFESFGEFGIVVSYEWAASQMAQRVLYVPEEGPIAVALRGLFVAGHDDLNEKIKYPENAAAQMAFTNKAMAQEYGGVLWANLLTLYEYMEPERHAYESEWRIVHPLPLYGYPPKEAIIQRASPPQSWNKFIGVLRAPEDAVIGFVCPLQHEQSFVRALPSSFSSRPIRHTSVD